MKIHKIEIQSFFNKCERGTIIAGILPGKSYKFVGFSKYIGKGKYSLLNGTEVIIIESNNRKRKLVKLFLEPLVILSNCSFDQIGYGKTPSAFVELRYVKKGMKFPNILDYEPYYKAVAKFIINGIKQLK